MSTPPPYLLPGFDSSRAKVAELRGILLAHDVPYNSVAKKPQLVALYEQHVRPQAPALLAEFRAVRASADGVLDGESQGSSLRELDTEPEEEPAPTRTTKGRTRTTRKSVAAAVASATASSSSSSDAKGKAKPKGKARAVRAREDSGDEDEDASMDEPEEVQPLPKQRGRARKSVRAPTPPVEMDIDEEEDLYEAPKEYEAPIRGVSEDEDEEDVAAPPPTLSPKKRKEPATPRLSDLVKKADSPSDGNFSDFNPFQSGEDTPKRDTKRRKSSMGPSRLRETGEASSSRLSPRKSMPATLPTQRRDLDAAGSWAPSPAATGRPRASAVFSPAPEPAEDIPPVPPLPSSSRAKQRASLGVASTSGTPVGVKYMVPVTKVKTTPPQVAEMLRQYEEAQSASAPASRAKRATPSTGRIAGPSPQTRRKSSSPVEELVVSPARSARQVVGQGKQLAADVIHLKEPARGSVLPSLAALRRAGLAALVLLSLAYAFWRRDETVAAGYCDTGSTTNARIDARRTSLALPALPDLPPAAASFADAWGLRPGCTPCPTHGHCTDGAFVGCTLDHVPVQPSALRTLGGWIPAPSVCVPDTAKQVAIARQASAGAHLLRRRRGDVLCRGLKKARKRDARARGEGEQDAFVFGMDAVAVLDELARANALSREPVAEDVVDEINRLALRDLEAHGEVLVWQNGDEYWYASKTAEMSYGCQARLFAKNWVKEHKLPLSGVLAAILGVFWLRHKLAQRKRDEVRKDQLVAIALHQLQQQARSHYADPVHIPFAHVAPSHLRDLVLQDEHSPARRAALWKRVAHVVEGNANVRVKDVEVNGEELRGWEWTGPMAGAAAAIEPAERPAMREGGNMFPSLPKSPAMARA
ncbi:inner nuclear membrane protein enriched at telomere/subtelomere region [Rhodotorula kratochvilovae]